MNPQESEALAQFCADQYFSFDARAWHRRSLYDRHASTIAALYLSMTSWYGHEDELARIAAESQALHLTRQGAQRDAPRLDSDAFAAMVRAEIARKRLTGTPPARQNRSSGTRAAL